MQCDSTLLLMLQNPGDYPQDSYDATVISLIRETRDAIEKKSKEIGAIITDDEFIVWNCLVMAAALNKHCCFACEHEWCLVMIPKWNIPVAKFPPPELVGGKLRYALHQASSTSRRHYTSRCIRGVMLPPHGNKEFTRHSARNWRPSCRRRPAIQARVYELRNFAIHSELECTDVGTNAKMNEMQALMGCECLKAIDDLLASRRTLHDYNVFTRRYFYPLLTDFAPYIYGKGSCPVAEDLGRRVLTLPTYYGLTAEEATEIAHNVMEIVK